MMLKKVFIYCIVVCLFSLPLSVSADINIGVLAHKGPLEAMSRWSDFGSYIEEAVGQPVAIVPIALGDYIEVVKESQLDFILANPIQTVHLLEKNNITPLASLNMPFGPRISGLIIAKAGSGIETCQDLKGKRVISLKHGVAGGAYVFQTYHLMQQGIDPHKDFAEFEEGKNHDDLVLAVKVGAFDAAFIRNGILEKLVQKGTITMDEFVVLDEQTHPEFSQRHSTALYPFWFFSAASDVDAALSESVKQACLALAPEDTASQSAHINGMVEALPLDELIHAMKALQVAPYDQ